MKEKHDAHKTQRQVLKVTVGGQRKLLTNRKYGGSGFYSLPFPEIQSPAQEGEGHWAGVGVSMQPGAEVKS